MKSKITRKLLSLVLSLVMVLCVIPLGSASAYSCTSSNSYCLGGDLNTSVNSVTVYFYVQSDLGYSSSSVTPSKIYVGSVVMHFHGSSNATVSASSDTLSSYFDSTFGSQYTRGNYAYVAAYDYTTSYSSSASLHSSSSALYVVYQASEVGSGSSSGSGSGTADSSTSGSISTGTSGSYTYDTTIYFYSNDGRGKTYTLTISGKGYTAFRTESIPNAETLFGSLEGYEMSSPCWNTSANGTGTEYSAGTTTFYSGTKTIYLYAQWDEIVTTPADPEYNFTLIYDANAGTDTVSGMPTLEVNSGYSAVTSFTFAITSSLPTRDGYTFLGWSEDSAATEATYKAGDSLTISNDTDDDNMVVLYAVWEEAAQTYTVTFDLDGGEWTDAAATATEFTEGDTVSFADYTATKDGYVLSGWYREIIEDGVTTTKTYTTNYTLYMPAEDVELKAVWADDVNGNGEDDSTEKTYTVTYTDGLGGAVFTEETTPDLLSGTTTPEFKGSTYRYGYIFAGWDKKVAETVTESVIYTATWVDDVNNNGTPDTDEGEYTVTFKDGETVVETATSIEKMKLDISEIKPDDKDDAVFAGWTDGAGSVHTDTYTTTNADVILYAVWVDDVNNDGIADSEQNIYSVTYKYDDEVLVVYYYTDGEGIPEYEGEDPTKEGYIFAGWVVEIESLTRSVEVLGDTTYIPSWVKIPTDEICECDTFYDDYAATQDDGNWSVTTGDDGHCDVCGGIQHDECIDVDKDGICDVCEEEIVCDCGDDSTDVDGNGLCDTCGGTTDAHECTDVDKDGICDVCEEEIVCDCGDDSTDVGGDGLCDTCGGTTDAHECTDVDGDGECDNCGGTTDAHECTDSDEDGYCDGCKEEIVCDCDDDSTDEDGNGLCDTCGGTTDAHECTDVDGDGECDNCGGTTDAHECVDSDEDGYCDECKEEIVCDCDDDSTDEDGNGLCDTCGGTTDAHECVDVDGNGLCDTCGGETTSHECTDADGDGTCDGENCGDTVGGTSDDESSEHDYDSPCDCGNCQDTNADGYCDNCDYKIPTGHDYTNGGVCYFSWCWCVCNATTWHGRMIGKMCIFFWKLFGTHKWCYCGRAHY